MSEPDNELAERLAESARTATASLTAEEVEAVRRYQARDRTYELVAAVLRNPKSSDDLTEEQADLVDRIVRLLSAATRRWRTPASMPVYRGQRSLDQVFGAGPRVGRTIQPTTFLSTSVYRDVALEEFAAPPGPGGPALLELVVPAGTYGLCYRPSVIQSLPTKGSCSCRDGLGCSCGVSGRRRVSLSLTARCCREPIHRRSRGLSAPG